MGTHIDKRLLNRDYCLIATDTTERENHNRENDR